MSPRSRSPYRKPSGARINRGDKARALFEQGTVHPSGQAGRYSVEGSKPGTVYRVEVNPTGWIFCSCPDWARQYKASHDQALTCCKHAGAVALYRKAIKANVRPVIPAASPAPAPAPRCPDCGVELVNGRCPGREWTEKSRFLADNQPGFARRIGRDYYGMNRWRGWRLCGVANRRAGAALVAHDGRSVRVRLVEQPTEATA